MASWVFIAGWVLQIKQSFKKKKKLFDQFLEISLNVYF